MHTRLISVVLLSLADVIEPTLCDAITKTRIAMMDDYGEGEEEQRPETDEDDNYNEKNEFGLE